MKIKDVIELLNERIILHKKTYDIVGDEIVKELETIKAIIIQKAEEDYERKIQHQVG